MNFKRGHILSIINRIERGEIGKLPVAHEDRLMRFGFDRANYIAVENGCEIVVVNQESLSPQQEMVEDFPENGRRKRGGSAESEKSR